MAIKGFKDTDCIENIAEKGEIAYFEKFHLFPECFLETFFFNVLKWVYMEDRFKQDRQIVATYARLTPSCYGKIQLEKTTKGNNS